jgi:hypothetical protein
VWLYQEERKVLIMRKVSLILAVLLFAVPAWATVTITCEQVGDTNEVIVSYDMDSEPNIVRAFALDITVDSGATITDVNDDVNDDYDIYPGSIVISDGEIDEEGQAVADPNDHDDTQPGIDSNGITVEMGGLWSPPNDDDNAPPLTGVLLKFYVDGEHDCNVVITENDARGGVVLTDPDQTAEVNAPGCRVEFLECLIGGNADAPPLNYEYAAWANPLWNKPACWCYCRQCRGDADGIRTGPYWVAIPDLGILYAAYGKIDTILATIPNGICADFDHKKTGPYRVAIPDLTIAYTYYGKFAHLVPPCDQAPVITGPYNFWCDPAGCPAECP